MLRNVVGYDRGRAFQEKEEKIRFLDFFSPQKEENGNMLFFKWMGAPGEAGFQIGLRV